MLFYPKLEATRSSETWDKPKGFYLRLHDVWIFCWLECAVQCVRNVRTCVPAYLVASCRSGTFKAAVTKGNCARDSELIRQ